MTYARHQFFVQDELGNVQPNAGVEVRSEADNSLATLYADLAGSTPLGNPLYSDSNGLVYFHAAGGQYKVTVSKGAFSEVFRYVQVGLASGADGATPGLKFTYSATTADADPGAGAFRLNSATLSSVTAAYIDNLDNSGVDVSAYLDTFDDNGQTSNRGVVEMRCLSDQSKFAIFRVTGSVVDGTGYRKLTLVHVASSGPLSGSVVFGFIRSGADGSNGATPAVVQTFSSTTTDADPGNGLFRFNNATLASVTAIYLDNLDTNGSSVAAWLDTLDDDGASGGRGTISFVQVSDASKFAKFKVTGSVVDGTGYRKLTVTHLSSNGPLSGACAIDFSATGATGAAGAGTGDMLAANNLSDLASKIAGLDNLTLKGSDIAAAGTLDLSTATGDLVDVTGNTGITAVTLASGKRRLVRFTGTPTLTHGASLILPGATNITAAAGDFAIFIGYPSSVVRVLYFRADGTPVAGGSGNVTPGAGVSSTRLTGGTSPGSTMYADAAFYRGYINGLTLSNNAVTPNTKLDVAAGVCVDDGANLFIKLTSGTIDCTTTGANGLDTGSLANSTWYHVFAISKADGTVSRLASTSALSPTLPSGYSYKRRLGSFRTNGSAQIIKFYQLANVFLWDANVADVSAANPGTSGTLYTLTVPTGVQVDALINLHTFWVSSNYLIATSPDQSNNTATSTNYSIYTSSTTTLAFNAITIRTDTSGRIRGRGSDGAVPMTVFTKGWIDYI